MTFSRHIDIDVYCKSVIEGFFTLRRRLKHAELHPSAGGEKAKKKNWKTETHTADCKTLQSNSISSASGGCLSLAAAYSPVQALTFDLALREASARLRCARPLLSFYFFAFYFI